MSETKVAESRALAPREKSDRRRNQNQQNDGKPNIPAETSTTNPSDTTTKSNSTAEEKKANGVTNNHSQQEASKENEGQQNGNGQYRTNQHTNTQYYNNNNKNGYYKKTYTNSDYRNNNVQFQPKQKKPYFKNEAQEQPETPIPVEQPQEQVYLKKPIKPSNNSIKPKTQVKPPANERFDNSGELAKIGESENQNIDTATMAEAKRFNSILSTNKVTNEMQEKISLVQSVVGQSYNWYDIYAALEELGMDCEKAVVKLVEDNAKKEEKKRKDEEEKEARRQREIANGLRYAPEHQEKPQNVWAQKQGRHRPPQEIISPEAIMPTIATDDVTMLKHLIETQMKNIKKQQEDIENMRRELEKVTDEKRDDVVYLNKERGDLVIKKGALEAELNQVNGRLVEIDKELARKHKEKQQTLQKLKDKMMKVPQQPQYERKP